LEGTITLISIGSWPMLSLMRSALSALGILASIVWGLQLLALMKHRNQPHWLADLPDSLENHQWPGLAVIFAARDEAPDVEGSVRSILTQDYSELRVVAVNDCSSDETGAILDRLAAEDPRLRVVHIRELPSGWLGKTHALNVGASEEASPWLLFTDADVSFHPGAMRRSMVWALQSGADHVCVVPEFVTYSVGERLFHTMFALAFASRVLGGRIEAADGRAHLGIGAFNLVRRQAFDAIGGFKHLSLSVDDDNRLAQALKAAGCRCRALLGKGVISVRWHMGLWGLIRGLEKNLFAMVDFRIGVVVAACLGWLGLCAPHFGLLIGPWWTRSICGLGVASVALVLAVIRRQTGIRSYYALFLPAGAALYVFTLIRSAWITISRGGVSWRGRHYSLPELREHVRFRNSWLRMLRGYR
jgi:glycosyltransferase involved in cell wall biosynthesis